MVRWGHHCKLGNARSTSKRSKVQNIATPGLLCCILLLAALGYGSGNEKGTAFVERSLWVSLEGLASHPLIDVQEDYNEWQADEV